MPFSGKKIILATIELTDRNGCLCTLDFTARGHDGFAGYFKMAHGNEPEHSEEGHSLFWTDNEGKTYIQDANGVSKQIILVEDEQ